MARTKNEILKFLPTAATLTGSRLFLKREGVDWDFVADAENFVNWIPWLKEEKFKERVSGRYCDDDTVVVYEKRFSKKDEDKVQIVFSKDITRKRLIIRFMLCHPELVEMYYKTDKRSRKKLWNKMYHYFDRNVF